MLPKPYKRIYRPHASGDLHAHYNGGNAFNLHPSYANDLKDLIRSYYILENDILHLFNYIEPSTENEDCFSHRTYELLMRCCTEFEANCNAILRENQYTTKGNWTIKDFYKIDAATKLSEYIIYINVWRKGKKELQPFSEWKTGHSLSWYDAYNKVKHSRHEEFNKASLNNLLNALAGVFCILGAQFERQIFSRNYNSPRWQYYEKGRIFESESLFSIVFPNSWKTNELYSFDWPKLLLTQDPFDNFIF